MQSKVIFKISYVKLLHSVKQYYLPLNIWVPTLTNTTMNIYKYLHSFPRCDHKLLKFCLCETAIQVLSEEKCSFGQAEHLRLLSFAFMVTVEDALMSSDCVSLSYVAVFISTISTSCLFSFDCSVSSVLLLSFLSLWIHCWWVRFPVELCKSGGGY